MTRTIRPTTKDRIDPARLYTDGAVSTEERTFEHDQADHCEAEAAGRAIVGVTDGPRLLLLTNPTEGRVILPNATVDSGERWAAVGQERVAGLAGLDVTLEAVRMVRRVHHRVDGEHQRTTHHVLFSGTADASAPLAELCADNDWSVGWHESLPYEFDDGDSGVLADVRRLL
jgi:hypothetical protein